jgi:hypothetical protein
MKIVKAAVTALGAVMLHATCSLGQVDITVNNNLVFGDVLPRVPKTVSKRAAGQAAEFHVSGPAGQKVIVTFTLPEYMNMTGYSMKMIFYETDCAMDSTLNQASKQSSPGYDNIDPWHPITYGLGTNGLTIWLGGKVVPGMVQPPGDYAADIVIRVDTTSD